MALELPSNSMVKDNVLVGDRPLLLPFTKNTSRKKRFRIWSPETTCLPEGWQKFLTIKTNGCEERILRLSKYEVWLEECLLIKQQIWATAEGKGQSVCGGERAAWAETGGDWSRRQEVWEELAGTEVHPWGPHKRSGGYCAYRCTCLPPLLVYWEIKQILQKHLFLFMDTEIGSWCPWNSSPLRAQNSCMTVWSMLNLQLLLHMNPPTISMRWMKLRAAPYFPCYGCFYFGVTVHH